MQSLPLPEEEKKTLLNIARQSIENYLQGNIPSTFDISSPALLANKGAFVTLRQEGQLRGCIGTFTANKPVYKIVEEIAISAATKDPRFHPISIEDLNQVNIEISVLSPLKKINDIYDIEIGRHGIYITKGFFRGVLLPQVAIEHNWDRETFLKNTCLKAGLSQDSWKEGADIYVFTAEIFGDKNL